MFILCLFVLLLVYFELVHDVEAIHDLVSYLLTTSEIIFCFEI